jgi:isopropylmalate/homocitrate/citramalate synthase
VTALVERMINGALMENLPWHTDQWFTSPWNHEPAVRETLELPAKVVFHDTTLRDGEQQAGVLFTARQKVRIAGALAEAGVGRIEAGMPAVSPEDQLAIKEIVKAKLPSEIYVLSRCMRDDVQRAIDCGVDGVVMEIPSSRHLVELGYRWTVERALNLCIEATSYAAAQGLKVAFFPVDASRADINEFLDLIQRVSTDGHMDSLGLVDTFGVLTPQAAAFYTQQCKRFGVPLEAHFHMDYEMGVANSCMSVASGATVIHTTVGGLGERAGNTPLEATAMALQTLYNVPTGLDTTKLKELNNLVMSFAGVAVPDQKAIVGDRIFQIESGMVAGWFGNVRDQDLTEVFPYDPKMVGQHTPEVVLGKGSGPDSIVMAAADLGYTDLSGTEITDLLLAVKMESLGLRRLLTQDEFAGLLTAVRASSTP